MTIRTALRRWPPRAVSRRCGWGREPPTHGRASNDFSWRSLLDAWVNRCRSPHTRRCYREDVLHFVAHCGWAWPEDAAQLLGTTVPQVQAYRDALLAAHAAPKTLNRRICSLSGCFKYLGSAAAELRLPMTVPNPGVRDQWNGKPG